MHELPLNGIPGSKPIGAMAAFGLLRIVAAETPFGDARLSWRLDSDWHPVLHTQESTTVDSVIEFLIHRQPKRSGARFLGWNDDIKCDPDQFRNAVVQASESEDYEGCLYFAAYGSDAITAKSTPDVKPTAFHMTAGQQRFLKSTRDLAESLDPGHGSSQRQADEQRVAEVDLIWRETLGGPWTYRDSTHSLGWDPTTEALHALCDRSPSAVGARAVRGAVWLAFESLPLFPSVPGQKQLLTTGFNQGGTDFTWPVWEPPISVESLRYWLAAPNIAASTPDMMRLHYCGIAALFRAHCSRDGNGRGTFRNAVQIS